MLTTYPNYIARNDMRSVLSMMYSNQLALVPCTKLLDTKVWQGKVVDLAPYQITNGTSANIALSEAIAIPLVKRSKNFMSDLKADMLAAVEHFGVDEVQLSGFDLLYGSAKDLQGATIWNSPRIASDKYAAMDYDKKTRYKLRQIRSAMQNYQLLFEVNPSFASSIKLVRKCSQSLMRRFGYAEYNDALLQVIYGLCMPTCYKFVLADNSGQELAVGLFYKHDNFLVFQSVVVFEQLPNIGNMLLMSVMDQIVEGRFAGIRGIDPTAETDPYVPSSSDIYKRLMVNESCTRYGIIGATDTSDYSDPVIDLSSPEMTDWPENVFMNAFDLEWEHDDKIQ